MLSIEGKSIRRYRVNGRHGLSYYRHELTKRKTIRTYASVYLFKNCVMYGALFACVVLSIWCWFLSRANEKYEVAFNEMLEYQMDNGLISDEIDPEALVNNFKNEIFDCIRIKKFDNELSEKLDKMVVDMKEQDLQNASLVAANNAYYDELKVFRAREELYNKYEYALYDRSGKRNDITFDQLKTAEKIMVDNGIDPNLLFSIVMTESQGKESAKNAASTATGYGQVLVSTGKTVYEKMMNAGKFNSSLLLDGDTNLEICATYLNYLKQDSSSVYQIVNRYRGTQDSAYCATLNKYLEKSGTSLAQLNTSLYERNSTKLLTATIGDNDSVVFDSPSAISKN